MTINTPCQVRPIDRYLTLVHFPLHQKEFGAKRNEPKCRFILRTTAKSELLLISGLR